MSAQYCGQPSCSSRSSAILTVPLVLFPASLSLFPLWKWASVHGDLQPHPQGKEKEKKKKKEGGGELVAEWRRE